MKHRILFAICCLLLPIWPVGAAQRLSVPTLSDQYESYLKEKCANLNFQRDEDQQLLPGQAGPHLFDQCTGYYSLPSGGPSFSNASQGDSVSESSSGSNQDGVVARRRDRARNKTKPAAGDDFTLLETGGSSVFLSFDYQRQNQKQTEYQNGRRANSYVGSLGIDKRLGTKGLVGAIARYTAQSGDTDAGGDFASHAIGGVVYGSWFPVTGMFVDASASLDRWKSTTRRLVAMQTTVVQQSMPYYTVDIATGQVTMVTPPPQVTVFYSIPPTLAVSDATSHESGANLLMGYDFSLGRFSFGPRAGVRLRESSTDPASESGDTLLTLAYDEQKRNSVRSTAGLQAAMNFSSRRGVFVTQANVDWVHEYRDDQKLFSARFAEDYRIDAPRLNFLTQPPDRDFFEARMSVVAVLPHGASIFLSINSNFGNALLNQRGATLGARLEL